MAERRRGSAGTVQGADDEWVVGALMTVMNVVIEGAYRSRIHGGRIARGVCLCCILAMPRDGDQC